jgi:type III secretion protein S
VTHDVILAQVNAALTTVLLVVAPILLASVGVGLIVGLLQAVTQIQDQTLPQAIKLLLVLVLIVIFGPLLGKQVTNQALGFFDALPGMSR